MNRKNQGQLLIEALVAISVLMIGMMAVFGVLSQSMSLNRVAADQYVAANLASEGVEIIRGLIDSGYNPEASTAFTDPVLRLLYESTNENCAIDINTKPGDGCRTSDGLKFTEGTGVYSIDGDSLTKFRRYVNLSYNPDPNNEYIEVSSTVEWDRRGGVPSEIKVMDRIYNWRRAQISP